MSVSSRSKNRVILQAAQRRFHFPIAQKSRRVREPAGLQPVLFHAGAIEDHHQVVVGVRFRRIVLLVLLRCTFIARGLPVLGDLIL